MTRPCPTCGKGVLEPGTTSETYERDGRVVVVAGIPALCCTNCAEAIIELSTLEAIESMVEDAFRAGQAHPALKFKAA